MPHGPRLRHKNSFDAKTAPGTIASSDPVGTVADCIQSPAPRSAIAAVTLGIWSDNVVDLDFGLGTRSTQSTTGVD